MSFTIDTSGLKKLDQALANSAKTVSDRRVAGSALRSALKPMLEATKRNAPVGNEGAQRISIRSARKAQAKQRDPNAYRKGGATRADQRIKIVAGKGVEVARGLVGTDKRKGKVGWRTKFITRTNKHRRVADDFLGRSYQQEISGVNTNYGNEMSSQVEKTIKRNL